MAPSATAPEVIVDEQGTWLPLPDDARWDRHEGAFLVAGTPVMSMGGTHYLDESDPDDSPIT